MNIANNQYININNNQFSTWRITKRINDFTSNLKEKTIDEYFNINNDYLNEDKFLHKYIKVKNITENSIIISIDLSMKGDYFHFPKLPPEINYMIQSFNYININFELNISFHNKYPFRRPNWSLVKESLNTDTLYGINMSDYIEHIIKTHNDMYKLDWSPAISVEHDILNFIERLNIFEYIFNQKLIMDI